MQANFFFTLIRPDNANAVIRLCSRGGTRWRGWRDTSHPHTLLLAIPENANAVILLCSRGGAQRDQMTWMEGYVTPSHTPASYT